MTRIVLVGAGSMVFTHRLLSDFFSHPETQSANVVLHDIDPARLRMAQDMAVALAHTADAHPRLEATLDRRRALRDADFVIVAVQVGGAAATQLDFAVAARHGLRYAINDTINVGGIFRALRTIPVLTAIVRDIEALCPDAWLINFTNPLSTLLWAVSRQSGVRAVGLCHSVRNTARTLARYLEVPEAELEYQAGGVNHLAFMLRIERNGIDLYPALAEAVAAGRIPDTDLVRAELYKRLGYYPCESSEHHAEYSPWFIPKEGMVERFRIPIGEYLDRVAAGIDKFEATKLHLAAGQPMALRTSREYAADIIRAVVTGISARIVATVPNEGWISNLDRDACVEVPCDVGRDGVRPVAIGPLPLHLAAYMRSAIDSMALTVQAAVEQRRDAVYFAVMQDPIVQARLTLDETWRLTDEVIAAEHEWLPRWLGGDLENAA